MKQREVRDARGYFEGFEPRECGEHRTVGTYRAWCYQCIRCEAVTLRESK